MKRRGMISLTDSIAALSLVSILLASTFMQTNPTSRLLTDEIEYCQKVAEQVLLISEMKGYITELTVILKARLSSAETILEKIVKLCPSELACKLTLYDGNGQTVCTTGYLHDTVYGEAKCFISSNKTEATLLCQVSAK